MYSKTQIQTAGRNLVGWSQSKSAKYNTIPSDYHTADFYVNDLPGISVDLLDYVGAEKTISNYIPSIHDSELINVIESFIAKQKKDLETKELLSNITLIQNFIDRYRQIEHNGRFVGYAITPRESKSIVSKIQQIGFISKVPQTFTIYLYVTSSKEAIQTKNITITKADTLEWFTLDWDVWFDSDSYGAGQHYLIGYYENDLTTALYESDWTGSQSHIAQKVFGHYMGIAPFRFPSGVLDGVNLPDCKYLRSSLNCMNSGFNLRFNTKCNITKVLTDNISMFGQALQYQIAIRILNDALSNIELNNVTGAVRNQERWEELRAQYTGMLKGGVIEGTYIPGIIDRLSVDFSYLDSVCLKNKANQVTGVKW
jgi:hypothetical protein